jgi:hypothetical protein
MGVPPPDAQWYLPTVVTVCIDGVWMPGFDFCASRGVQIHVITAWNPGDERPSEEVNEAQNERLRLDIEALGLTVFDALGKDPKSDHAEKSLAVLGLDDDRAKHLGRNYHQVAIFKISQARQIVLGCFNDWEVSRGCQISIGYENIASWISNAQNFARIERHFKDYFEKRVGDRAKNVWHGQHFEWFANRVARDCFTEVDLAAIGALSVELKAQTARELIEDSDGNLRQRLQECELWIAANGADASSTDLGDSWLEEKSPFSRLYFELKRDERIDLGTVKASKLMAAKYLGLIPIRDGTVAALLAPMPSDLWWRPMRDLAVQVKTVLDKLEIERDDIRVMTLRKLDVVLWMEAKDRGF